MTTRTRTSRMTRSSCPKAHRLVSVLAATTIMMTPTLMGRTTRTIFHYLLVHRHRSRLTRHRYRPGRGVIFLRCVPDCTPPVHRELHHQYPSELAQVRAPSPPVSRRYLLRRRFDQGRPCPRLISRTLAKWRRGAPYSLAHLPRRRGRDHRDGSRSNHQASRTPCRTRQRRRIRGTGWPRRIYPPNPLPRPPPAPSARLLLRPACPPNPVLQRHHHLHREIRSRLQHRLRTFWPLRQSPPHHSCVICVKRRSRSCRAESSARRAGREVLPGQGAPAQLRDGSTPRPERAGWMRTGTRSESSARKAQDSWASSRVSLGMGAMLLVELAPAKVEQKERTTIRSSWTA